MGYSHKVISNSNKCLEVISMKCVNCNGENVFTQIIPVNKRKRMPFKLFMNMVLGREQFLLIMLPVVGWLVLLIIYLRGYKIASETWSICQDCGYKWEQI